MCLRVDKNEVKKKYSSNFQLYSTERIDYFLPKSLIRPIYVFLLIKTLIFMYKHNICAILLFMKYDITLKFVPGSGTEFPAGGKQIF